MAPDGPPRTEMSASQSVAPGPPRDLTKSVTVTAFCEATAAWRRQVAATQGLQASCR